MQAVSRKGCSWLAFLALIIFVLCPYAQISAQEKGTTEIKEELEKLKKRVEELEEEKEEEPERTPTFVETLVDKATFSGFIELDYDYYDVSDSADKESDSTTDLGLGTVELALKVIFSEWVKSNIALRAEDIGKGGSDNVFVEEAIFTLECPVVPLYFIGGKTQLPFGVFENHLISDTLTEELYEIEQVGATLGFAPDFYGLDISVTVYEGEDVISNLEAFGTHEARSGIIRSDYVGSFIANVTAEPLEEMLTLMAFYVSEPGDMDRNQSVGGALTLSVWKLTLDAEYITALEREKGSDNVENKDCAWEVGLACQVLEPLELAARYEDFDDDREGDQAETVDYRFLVGLNWSFLDFATFSVEYRHISFEEEIGSNAADDQNELHFRLAVAF